MASRFHQWGVTLIELLIALALGLFITSGILYIYLGSRVSYSTQGAVSNVQETLRFGFEYLSYDIRMAGYMGCANLRDMTPQVVANPPVPTLGLGGSLVGHDNGSGWTNPTTVTRVAGTDVLSISRAAPNGGVSVACPASDGSQVFIESNPYNFAAGQLLIVADCSRSDVFRATSISNASGKVSIAHASSSNTQPTGSSCAPGSGKLVTECKVGNYTGACGGAGGGGARVSVVEGWDYFIGINPRGNPSLYRVNTTTAAINPEELVEGVYDMQFSYGLDTVDDTVFVADSYSSTPANWAQVVSVAVTISARGADDNVVPDSTTYSYNGANVSDRRYRQTQTTVVGLRNLVQ